MNKQCTDTEPDTVKSLNFHDKLPLLTSLIVAVTEWYPLRISRPRKTDEKRISLRRAEWVSSQLITANLHCIDDDDADVELTDRINSQSADDQDVRSSYRTVGYVYCPGQIELGQRPGTSYVLESLPGGQLLN